MKYVLDTNTLSFAMAGDPPVSERLLSQARTDVLLPQPVIAEVEYGLARLRTSKKRDRLLKRFRAFLDEMPRAPWTDAVSHAFGRVKAELERRGIPIEDFGRDRRPRAGARRDAGPTTSRHARIRGLESSIGARYGFIGRRQGRPLAARRSHHRHAVDGFRSRTSMSRSPPTRWRSTRRWSATTSSTCAAFAAFESRIGVSRYGCIEAALRDASASASERPSSSY